MIRPQEPKKVAKFERECGATPQGLLSFPSCFQLVTRRAAAWLIFSLADKEIRDI